MGLLDPVGEPRRKAEPSDGPVHGGGDPEEHGRHFTRHVQIATCVLTFWDFGRLRLLDRLLSKLRPGLGNLAMQSGEFVHLRSTAGFLRHPVSGRPMLGDFVLAPKFLNRHTEPNRSDRTRFDLQGFDS